MIRIGCLFPEHLNLNGDYGNVEVISKQLTWRGLDSVVLPVTTPSDLENGFDFIFAGHGSMAAWSAINGAFSVIEPTLAELFANGLPGLAISTGYERLVAAGIFGGALNSHGQHRLSKFAVESDLNGEVLGYINTESTLPVIRRERNLVGTMFHGPILAKNTNWLDELMSKIATHAGVDLKPIQESKKADRLADLIERVWELERELANE